MFKKGLKFLAVPVLTLTAISSSVLVNNRLIEQGIKNENISELNYSSKETVANVSNWEEFSSAATSTTIEEISLSGDIDLTDATSISSISNKKIIGNGNSFVNREIDQSSGYLIETATNVTFDNVSFDNVEMFINDYIIDDSTEAISETLFNNVGIYEMTFDSVALSNLNGGDFTGMFINDIDISISNSASFSNIPLINGLIVDSASVTASSLNPSTLGVVAGTFDVTDGSGALSGGTDGYLAKIAFSNSTFDLSSATAATNVSLLGQTSSTSFDYVIKGSVISGVEVMGATGSTAEIIRGNNISGSLDYVASLMNSVNGSSESAGIVSVQTSATFSSTSYAAIVGDGVTDSSELAIGTGVNVSYTGDDKDLVVRETRVTTTGTDYNVIRGILNETFGSSSYSVKTIVEEEVEYFEGITLFKDKSLEINQSKGDVSGNKMGELILEYSYFNESSNPIPYPLFINSTFEVDGKKFDAVNTSDDSETISFDNDTKQYSMKVDLKGTKKSTLESKGATFRSTMTYESDSARATKSEEIEIYISGSDIFANFEENNVVFLSVAGLVLTIIFAIILLILLILLIWWLIKRKQKRDALAKVDGVNSGYYRYVQNEPVEIPEDPNLHDYDNQFGDYATSSDAYAGYEDGYSQDYDNNYDSNQEAYDQDGQYDGFDSEEEIAGYFDAVEGDGDVYEDNNYYDNAEEEIAGYFDAVEGDGDYEYDDDEYN